MFKNKEKLLLWKQLAAFPNDFKMTWAVFVSGWENSCLWTLAEPYTASRSDRVALVGCMAIV